MPAIEETINGLLEKEHTFSAVLASEDQIAIGAMNALIKKGFKIPEDMAIIGFNNSLLCECTLPALSSVDNMVETLCSMAVNVLTDVFEGKSVTNKMILSGKLIERDTFKI